MITYTSCPSCQSKNIQSKIFAKDYTVSNEVFAIWECADCTLCFTQHIPEQSAIGAYYQSDNYISHTDTKKGIINRLYHVVRKRTLRGKLCLIKHFTGIEKGHLLDIGAGTGAFLSTMQQAGWNVSGLEPDADTRKRALESYRLSLESSDKLFQLTTASFDAVTLWHVLEHVHDLHEYIEQIKRIIKPGGKIFIAVPNYTSHDADVYKEHWAAYDVPRHLYHFSPAAMKRLLQQHGLKLVAKKPMWYDSFYVSMLSEQYKTGSANTIKAIFNGFISDIKTIFNKERCSSLIYIITPA